MTSGVPTPPIVDAAFGSLWPERGLPARRDVLLACLGIGVFAGLSIPYVNAGLAVTLMLLASGLLVLWVSRHRRSPFTWACAALAAGFALHVRRAGRRVDPRTRAADQRTAHHGGADERPVDRRDGARSDLLAVRGTARHAVAGSHDPGRRWRRQQRRGDPDRDPVRAGPARLRAPVRDRRRDRRPLAQPGAPRRRGGAGAARLRRRRGDRDRPRSGVPRAEPAGAELLRRTPTGAAPLRVAGARAARRRGLRAVPRGAGGGVLRWPRLHPQRHRAHLRRVRPPGLRPADLRHGADADRGLGGVPQGGGHPERPVVAARLAGCAVRAHPRRGRLRAATGWTSTRTPTASPGCGCWWTCSRAGWGWSSSGCSSPGSGCAAGGSRGWPCSPVPRCCSGSRLANPDAWIARAQHRALRDDRQGRLVLPPRAQRRRGADAGSLPPEQAACALERPVAREGRLGRLEPLPRTRRRRPGRLRAAERRGLQ